MSSQDSANPVSAEQGPAPTVSKKIPRKFAFTVCLFIVLAMCSFWLIDHNNTRTMLRQQADSLGATLARQVAAQLTELVLANDLVSMNVILRDVTGAGSISEISVLSVDNDVLASVQASVPPPRLLLPLPISIDSLAAEYRAPIRLADAIAGTVRLRLDLAYIEATMVNNLILITGVTLLLVIAAALLTSTYFQALVSFPARLLAFSLHNIRQGKIDTCPEPKNNDELAMAIRQYNATAEFLAQNTFLNKFGERLPDLEDGDHLAQPGQQEMTLLAIRLANFEYLASTRPQDDLVRLLNKFYFYASKVSQLYSGSISYCSHGEVLIDFSSLPLEEEQAFFAICAGQLFLHLIDDLCDLGEDRIQAKFRLAVNSGNTVTGVYSPISGGNNNLMGASVDRAWELCDDCPDNRLLISASSMAMAGEGTRVDADRFAQEDSQEGMESFLGREPMSEYKLLIERQAIQLVSLYSD